MKAAQVSDAKPRKAASTRRRKTAPAEQFDHAVGECLGATLTVTRQISAGPFTEIYQVWCADRLSFFALKLLRAGVTNASADRRYLGREYAVLRRTGHPHVVRVFDPDPELDRRHVLMEFLPGSSLLDRLAATPRRRLPVVEAVTTAVQIGSGVAHLHRQGYLYRDFKPANVLEGNNGSVLIDFGSVHRFHEGRPARERLGTDPYMAPEQCLGEPLSVATDVFGLGALLYEALTGEWAFEDQLMNVFDRTKLENRFPQTAHEVKSVRRRAPHVDRDLDDVVRKCLARDPANRFQSMTEVVTDLLAFADGLAKFRPGAAA